MRSNCSRLLGSRAARGMLAAVAGSAATAAPARSQTVRSATLIAITGSTLPGSDTRTVHSLNPPYTSGNGRVGFTGTLNTDQSRVYEGFVFSGDQIVWRNSWAPPGVTLYDPTARMGIGDSGQYIFATAVSQPDHAAVWGQNGLIAVTDQACQDGSGLYWVWAVEPMMLPDGTAYFFGGTAPAPGWMVPNQSGIWRVSPDGQVYVRVLGTGDVVDGLVLLRSQPRYAVSDNGQHLMQLVTMGPSVSTRSFVYVDGELRHEIGKLTGSPAGDHWLSPEGMSINDSGHYVFFGTTTPPYTWVVVVDGRIKIRSGDAIPGMPYQTGFPGSVSINNRGQLAVIWGTSSNSSLILGFAPLIRSRGAVLLRTGDQVDVDGDGAADYTIVHRFDTDYQSNSGVDLAMDQHVDVGVDLTPAAGGPVQSAIIRLEVPLSVRCPADWNQNGSVEPNDIGFFVQDWFADLSNGTLNSDFDGDEAITPIDICVFVNAWLGAVAGAC